MPCDHLLFEARLSERDFPWLAEHRVHHASIMPAAGYVELLLQAFNGAPLHVESLEFLQPCPIPKTPVRLQTELFPVTGAPDRYTFTISSRTYDVDANSELHSRGTLRLVSADHPVNVPLRMADIDTSSFKPYYYVGESDFYERVDASLGETFQYGPNFRNIQRVLWEDTTANYLFDVEMDERLWTEGREEGYVANPALLDGGLQIFLYHLLRATDIFAMPRRAVGVTFLRPPTGPRLTCYVKKDPDWADINEQGQFTERRGERSGGSIRFYDGDTGNLVLCIDAYVSFNSNPSWNDRPNSKHAVSWQPKFVPEAYSILPRSAAGGDGEWEPAALIAALEQPSDGGRPRYACHVLEVAGARAPEQAIANRCFDYLGSAGAQTEYWLLGDTDEQVRAHYDAFHNRNAALRFTALDVRAGQAPEPNSGLLRPHAAEILLLHDEAAAYGPEPWRLLRRLAVPGALALVCHDTGDAPTVEPGAVEAGDAPAPDTVVTPPPAGGGTAGPGSGWRQAGWTTVRSGRRATLLQAPLAAPEAAEPRPPAGPRWVIGEPGSLAGKWSARLEEADPPPPNRAAGDDGEPHRAVTGVPAAAIPWAALADEQVAELADWPYAADLQAIDFFCGTGSDGTANPGGDSGSAPHDPTGEQLAWRLVAFVKALIPYRVAHARCPCRLTVVTRRAAFEAADPRASAAWGALRAIAQEVAAEAGAAAQIDFRLVDLDGGDDLDALAWIDTCDLRERELAVRGGRVWAPRLISLRERFPRVPAEDDAAYRLSLDNPGQIGGLQMKTFEPGPLGPHDVEIEVAAAALNFRDVMVTLGLLPSSSFERSALGRTVGLEASGIVRRAGADVRTCGAGDAVVFTQGGCIANRAVAKDYLVFRKPDALSMEQAASVLSVYVTAYYSLIHLARLREGQRVLIHSAMGGVGQAAIALARHAGAEIYATAGSESKREQLRALGVRAAFDSHSLDWYDELLAATGGEGVDAVLNSLAGRHIALCLEALRPGGWHCEIGKVDIYADNALSLSVFRKNLRFAAIDVDRLMNDDPYLTRELSQQCLDLLEQGAVPPPPVATFPYRDYEEPLRLMTSGQHTGKLVLTAPPRDGSDGDDSLPVADLRPYLDSEATYLVSGAFGGFGRLLLPYLATAGARHITLLDRDPQRRRSADALRKTSALWYLPEDIEIDIVACDVAAEVDVRRCIAGLQRPLKGVFHLAGTLDDCLLADLTAESLAKVFAPKARGALHLHHATAGCDLDHFVLFSSIASTLGNPGQVNYSAANGFVDGLASLRRAQGLPVLCYNLAAVAEAGMAARNLHVLRMSRAGGVPPVSADFAITNLDYAMRAMGDRDHLVTALFSRPPWTVDSPDYLRTGRMLSNQDAFAVDAGGQLTQDAVVAQLADKVAELCGHDEGSPEEPLSSFGLTSISVAELGAFIRMQFNHQVSALELMTTATCLSLAEAIMSGDQAGDDEDAGAESEGAEHTAAEPPPARRVSSAFASAPADHFPDGNAPEADGNAAPAGGRTHAYPSRRPTADD